MTGEKLVKLPKKDIELFFKLYLALLLYANQQLKVIKGATTPKKFEELSLEKQMEVRDALFDKPSLIDSFAAENHSKFTRFLILIVLKISVREASPTHNKGSNF